MIVQFVLQGVQIALLRWMFLAAWCYLLLDIVSSTCAHILHGIKHHMYSESVNSLSKSEINQDS